MQQGTSAEIDRRGRAGYHHHRHSFCVCSRHAIDGAQFPDAEGGGKSTYTPDARVTVSGIGRVEFVACADIVHLALQYLVEEAEDKVARHAEQVIHADLFQANQQIFGNRDFRAIQFDDSIAGRYSPRCAAPFSLARFSNACCAAVTFAALPCQACNTGCCRARP